ncbi:TPA: hypothetical protein ACH3X1_014390 [Trebouxia sp. C0004]
MPRGIIPDISATHEIVSKGMRAHWKCIVCSYEWQALVSDKVRGKTGCPKCAKAHAGRKADGTRQKHPTFAAAKHALLEQWDYDRNREKGYFPDNTTIRSNKPIWWHCHEANRVSLLYWALACECNSLETVCSDIAADFDVEKNGVTAEVTSSATTKYSWLSAERAKNRSANQRTKYIRRKFITDIIDARRS